MSHLAELVASATAAINQVPDVVALDNVRVGYLGRGRYLILQMTTLREPPPEERPVAGAVINGAKEQVQQAPNTRKAELENTALNARLTEGTIDIPLPGRRIENGGLRPMTCTIDRIEGFFGELGFTVVTGLEIEDGYYNSDTLNIPGHRPARADHGTFWFDATRLLRTQTSGVQIRAMREKQSPIRITVPDRVYRNNCDQIHTPVFHQMEELTVGTSVNSVNLESTLHDFLHNLFEEDLQVHFRPSYLPFTEPSAEVGVTGKNDRWLEVLGCGMIHPNALRNAGIGPEIYSGLIFGMGMGHFTILRYDVADLHPLLENDLRFLKQFK